MKQLVTSGVRVFFYLEDRERTLNSPIEKATLSLQTMSDEMERDKARLRVTDAMQRKARAGHCCGGAVFGYDNVEVTDASGKRSHVERAINAAEAAVVRRIFDLSAAGIGYSRIAKQLNAEQAPAPRPKANRPAGWSPSTVKVILGRRLYLGEVIWNRTQKRDSWGQKRLQRRPEADWIRMTVPAPRIVPETAWRAAHGRLDRVRARLQAHGGALGNQGPRDIDSGYLLAGFARCAVCGGSFGVVSGSHRSARRHVYGCIAHRKRGPRACGNGLTIPLERVDRAVLATLKGDVLRPAVMMALVDGVLVQLQPDVTAQQLKEDRAALKVIDREISNLAKAIAAGGALEPLVELRTRQAHRDELLAAIAADEQADVRRFNRHEVEQAV